MLTARKSTHLFNLGGYQVRADIGAVFLIVILLLIFGGQGPQGLLFALVIAAITFVSILLHELGHAVAVRRLGYGTSTIVFSFLGGVTQWRGRPTHGDSIRIAAAGPAVSLALAGLALAGWAALRAAVPEQGWFHRILFITAFLNILWGAFNLLPIHPMDGGKILRSWLSMRHPGREAIRRSLIVSGVTGLILMLAGAFMGLLFVTVLLGFLLFQNWQEWQSHNQQGQ